jgi:hypothetical protein
LSIVEPHSAAVSSNSLPLQSVTATHAAYARGVKQFLDRRHELHDIDALTVAAYVEQLSSRTSKPTVNSIWRHQTAIRLSD